LALRISLGQRTEQKLGVEVELSDEGVAMLCSALIGRGCGHVTAQHLLRAVVQLLLLIAARRRLTLHPCTVGDFTFPRKL